MHSSEEPRVAGQIPRALSNSIRLPPSLCCRTFRTAATSPVTYAGIMLTASVLRPATELPGSLRS